ncbi:PTS transporter subunit EIIC [Thermoanaerobacterium thermosaccharolyticum]|uniref:PTS sugar transporter subunit IIC n=1 Tax=Thermoanaerobacterium thermosaccharolyticum TaxID=1517 RepID=UPI0027A44EBD|nr:PTS transporter subunit EIIC [Thermoanaerobacterium thermosaccharolyticum]
MNKISFTEKFSNYMQEKIAPSLIAFSENKYISAVSEGMMVTVPFLIIGGLFLIITSFPINAWQQLIKPYMNLFSIVSFYTFNIIALLTSITVSYSLAGKFNIDRLGSSLFSLICFLMLSIPDAKFTAIPSTYLGGVGLFGSIIISIISVRILKFFYDRKITIKLPEGIPENVAKSFTALMPGLILIFIIWFVRVVLNFDLNKWVINILKPIVLVGDSIFAAIVIPLINKTLWFVGIHGGNITGAVANPILLMYATQNAQAAQSGAKILPYITSPMFYDNIALWGNSMVIPILLIFTCKNKGLKQLGKLALPIGIFNIGEPIMYGLPIILNPFMLLPLMLSRILPSVLAWIVLRFNLVTRPYIMVPWTTPPIIGGYLATGGDFRAIILTSIIFIIQLAIFYPFIKLYDNYLEKNQEMQKVSQ